jgi:hypothetical protein
MSELQYQGGFAVGDRVEIVEGEDGSWNGDEGTVIHVYRQKGGVFGPTRDVEIVVPDAEDPDGLAETEEGRAKLFKQYEDGDGYFLSSDDFVFDPA